MTCTCAVCGNEIDRLQCPNCSFDNTQNYERYPTLALVRNTAAISDARSRYWRSVLLQNMQNIQGGAMLDPERYTPPPLEPEEAEFTPFLSDASETDEGLEEELAPGVQTIDSGHCGPQVQWQLFASGMFHIRGRGYMYDYARLDDVPWARYREQIREVILDEGIDNIGDRAFGECRALTDLFLPDSITYTGEYAFFNCDHLSSVHLPAGLTAIGNWSLEGCTHLSSLQIPGHVGRIGRYALENCAGLTALTIPPSVTDIGSFALQSCSHLKKLVIPATVMKIGEYALNNCERLTAIYYGGSLLQWRKIAPNVFGADMTVTVYCNTTLDDAGEIIRVGEPHREPVRVESAEPVRHLTQEPLLNTKPVSQPAPAPEPEPQPEPAEKPKKRSLFSRLFGRNKK